MDAGWGFRFLVEGEAKEAPLGAIVTSCSLNPILTLQYPSSTFP